MWTWRNLLANLAILLAAANAQLFDQQLLLGAPPASSSSGEQPLKKAIGDACQSDIDCEAQYSACSLSKCQCLDGFAASANGACTPKTVECPFGKPLETGGSVQTCERRREWLWCDGNQCSPLPPQGSSAAAAGNTTTTSTNVISSVPVHVGSSGANGKGGGDEHSGRNKRQDSSHIEKANSSIQAVPLLPPITMIHWSDSCPQDYFCAPRDPVLIENVFKGHCCLKPTANCPIGVPKVNVSCNFEDLRNNNAQQCPQITHYCHQIAMGVAGGLVSVCCPRSCPTGAIPIGTKCLAPARVGEACQDSLQCEGPAGVAICHATKKRCVCESGFIARNGVCYKPACMGPTPVAPLTQKSGDFLECNSTGECPDNAYCALNHQVCCPKPSAYCPLPGLEPGKACKPPLKSAITSPSDTTCGPQAFCFRYFYPVESDKSEGVCCPQVLNPPLLSRSSNGLPRAGLLNSRH